MPNKSKNKGKAFERWVADTFSIATGENFERVPNSGSFVGGRNAARLDHLSEEQKMLSMGDIICSSNFKNCVIECKWHGAFPFHKLIDSESPELNSWIAQASIDYDRSKAKVLMVIFKIDYMGCYICTLKSQLDSLLGIDYLYNKSDNQNSKMFRITKFDIKWIQDNKEKILALCKT